MTPSQQQLAISLLKQAAITLHVIHEGDLDITSEIREFIQEVSFDQRFDAKVSNALNQD